MYEVLKKLVDACANWFEVVGFILTIFTAIKVFYINRDLFKFNKRHLFQVRSGEHITKLKEIVSKISANLADFENKKIEIREQLKKSEEIARSIVRKVVTKDADALKYIIREAKKIQKFPDSVSPRFTITKFYFNVTGKQKFSEDVVGQYYVKLTGLITYLEELKKDYEKSLMP